MERFESEIARAVEQMHLRETHLRGWLRAQVGDLKRGRLHATAEEAFEHVLAYLDDVHAGRGINEGTFANQTALVMVVRPKSDKFYDPRTLVLWTDGGPLKSYLSGDLWVDDQLGVVPDEPGIYLWRGSVTFSVSSFDGGTEYDENADGEFEKIDTREMEDASQEVQHD